MSLRSKDAMDRGQWGKKQSADSGIGSRAIKWIDLSELSAVRPVYDKVVSMVESLPENQQRAVLLAAFTFDSLMSKATTGGKLGVRQLKAWYKALPAEEQQRIMVEALKHPKGSLKRHRPNRR
jgi:hypothetical protein